MQYLYNYPFTCHYYTIQHSVANVLFVNTPYSSKQQQHKQTVLQCTNNLKQSSRCLNGEYTTLDEHLTLIVIAEQKYEIIPSPGTLLTIAAAKMRELS